MALRVAHLDGTQIQIFEPMFAFNLKFWYIYICIYIYISNIIFWLKEYCFQNMQNNKKKETIWFVIVQWSDITFFVSELRWMERRLWWGVFGNHFLGEIFHKYWKETFWQSIHIFCGQQFEGIEKMS